MWPAIAGRSYQMQGKGGLLDLNWSNLAPALTATSNTATATLTVTNAQGFYRVQLVP